MFGQTQIREAMQINVDISPAMQDQLRVWAGMYQNNPPWVVPGGYVKSLNLASAIASEIAQTATLEMAVSVTGSARADFLNEQLEDALMPYIREQLEYGCAKGGLILKPVVSGKRIVLDFVQADQCYPVEFTSRQMTACVFVDHTKQGNWRYTRLEYHHLYVQESVYVVRNLAFRSSSEDDLGSPIPLTEVEAWKNLEPITQITGLSVPLFSYFRFPKANNVDPSSRLGVSSFSRAVELLEEADRLWSNFLWEFKSGERAIYVDEDSFTDDSGRTKIPDVRLYRTLRATAQIGKEGKLIEDWTPELRVTQLVDGMEALLKKVEINCSLAFGTLTDPASVDKTATEVIASKQRSASLVRDLQKAVKTSVVELLEAMNALVDLYDLAPAGSWTADFDFDDSLITDKDKQFEQDKQAVNLGVMPKWLFLVRNYGLDEATAKKQVAERQTEVGSEQEMFNPIGA